MAVFEVRFSPYISFGSRTLETVSPNRSGTDVAILQAVYNLMLEAMEPPRGPMGKPIAIDGVFGPKTRLAVLSVQTYFGLTADGVAGPQTFFIYGQGVSQRTPYGGPRYGRRTLSQGRIGSDVKALQNRLNCFAYARQLGHPADGRFGPQTASALKAFQTDAAALDQSSLPANGIAGSATYDATWLYTFAGGRRLFVGRNGFDVVFLQAQLRALDLYHAPLDGYFGAATSAAVQLLQAGSGLEPDGVVGPRTFFQLGLAGGSQPPHPLPSVRF
ncbi:MAG: peptidoglycan-binding protein [Thermaerobacter sp.]|nr:peptidoglycan-binding protein [Thermaerobacter sp.]